MGDYPLFNILRDEILADVSPEAGVTSILVLHLTLWTVLTD